MTTTARPARPLSLTIARILTEILAPIVLIVGLLFAVAIHANPTAWRGMLYGAVTAFFAG